MGKKVLLLLVAASILLTGMAYAGVSGLDRDTQSGGVITDTQGRTMTNTGYVVLGSDGKLSVMSDMPYFTFKVINNNLIQGGASRSLVGNASAADPYYTLSRGNYNYFNSGDLGGGSNVGASSDRADHSGATSDIIRGGTVYVGSVGAVDSAQQLRGGSSGTVAYHGTRGGYYGRSVGADMTYRNAAGRSAELLNDDYLNYLYSTYGRSNVEVTLNALNSGAWEFTDAASYNVSVGDTSISLDSRGTGNQDSGYFNVTINKNGVKTELLSDPLWFQNGARVGELKSGTFAIDINGGDKVEGGATLILTTSQLQTKTDFTSGFFFTNADLRVNEGSQIKVSNFNPQVGGQTFHQDRETIVDRLWAKGASAESFQGKFERIVQTYAHYGDPLRFTE